MGNIPVTSERKTMGTVKDPREQQRKDMDDVRENDDQQDATPQAQQQAEVPEYKITDWASF